MRESLLVEFGTIEQTANSELLFRIKMCSVLLVQIPVQAISKQDIGTSIFARYHAYKTKEIERFHAMQSF